MLNFFTGFDMGYVVVMQKPRIVKNYLYGWFFIDLMATVSWSSVISMFGKVSDALEEQGNNPVVRMLR